MTIIISDRGLVELMSIKRYIKEEMNNCIGILNGEKVNRKHQGFIELKTRVEVYKEILKRIEMKEANISVKSSMCGM